MAFKRLSSVAPLFEALNIPKPVKVMGCFCAKLGKDAPCGWCDGPDRETVTIGKAT